MKKVRAGVLSPARTFMKCRQCFCISGHGCFRVSGYGALTALSCQWLLCPLPALLAGRLRQCQVRLQNVRPRSARLGVDWCYIGMAMTAMPMTTRTAAETASM